ncbi:phage major capsid protein [Glaciibacter psychrotolerans]|uniref:HK97 family phage major capsid protein n=1 Tax=Glaciibacter psychrotolerans TaxID=670054 RepID=A0A7Z0EGY7_9MICO|nr:phage major capsid protein [Leifsonia psychrotolerans]NYJ21459.1 HK97 family phage major capsid protein [Leifsonia psychrotolerans]
MANSSTLKTFLGTTEAGPLIIKPLERDSLALNVSTPIYTEAGTFRFPRITSDPSAAWTAENAEITVSEAAGDEVVVIPRKLAGLAVISNELAADTSPAAQDVIGRGLSRDIARKIDAAFFGTKPANTTLQPGGLEYLAAAVTAIAADPAAGLDAYIDALAAAEDFGVSLSAFVVNPATASALAKLKTGTGSSLPLFGTGATNGIERNILGVPLLVSPSVVAGTAWGIPKDRVFSVIRNDVSVVVDKSAYFSTDQTGVRAVLRAAFGFVQPEAIIKIKAAA